MVGYGHVALCAGRCAGSRRRRPVTSHLTTHEDHFLCDRDGRPTRTHIVQSFCLQVHCGVHTSTTTIIFGLAQHSAWEDKQQVRNEGGIDSASPTQRAIYEHVSHKGDCG